MINIRTAIYQWLEKQGLMKYILTILKNYGTTKLNYIKQNTNYWADLYNLHVYGDSYYEGPAQFNARLYVNNTTMGKVGVVLNRNITPDISFGWDGTYLRIYIDNTVIASYQLGKCKLGIKIILINPQKW